MTGGDAARELRLGEMRLGSCDWGRCGLGRTEQRLKRHMVSEHFTSIAVQVWTKINV